MPDLIDAYRDPLFWWFAVGGTLVSMTAFLVFAAPLTWIAATDPAWARPYRIQQRRARDGDVVWPSLVAFFKNNVALFVLVVASWPLIRHSGVHLGDWPPAWVIASQVLLFTYVDDFLFYWMHRAMHAPWLFKRVHFKHHTILAPWAITGHFMHPVEYVLTASLMLLGPVLLGAHVATVWLWVVVRQWEAAEGHAGYDFPFSPSHLIPGNDGATHHDFHHAKVRGNYAGFLAIWDRAFGTCSKGYEDDRARRKG